MTKPPSPLGASAPPAAPHASDGHGNFAARLMEHLAIGAFVLDAEGRVLIWNRACERLTGVPAAEVVGTRDHWKAFYESERPCLADLVLAGRFDEAAALYEMLATAETNPNGLAAENWCVMPRLGRRAYLGIDAGEIFNEMGERVAVVETLRDMTAQKLVESELVALAGRDPLTALANRRTFDGKLADAWTRAQRERTTTSLLWFDLDGFKQCNDLFGHSTGDRCLKLVAERIREAALRPGTLAARLGGDEFALLLPQTPLAEAIEIGGHLRREIEDLGLPNSAIPASARITLSIGVVASSDFSTMSDFIDGADNALYAAKRAGRNRVETLVRTPEAPRDRQSA